MRNPSLDTLDVLVGRWTLTLSDAWFLEPPGTELHGWATFEWLGDAFIVLRSEIGGHPGYDLAIGHSDARDAYAALYHDERGVSRLFQMTFDHASWTLTREDPDFHQRFLADVQEDAIKGRWEASEDEGRTWRKDYDLTFVRAATQP
ncbi:hypothetical protein F4561_000475 [Lipingzhangella halophila]|uniref:DUF1579 domain-containing protein n=1 Tax=Lipingzhangella halophila TaxID=1783352 RepID=A0A7W7W1G3_9ACTN|nr:hypothetical protein [Lipingzhangella halophila]MBB4929655.1 hypothetical protein [Lipingzhangella halophila]